MLRSVLVRAAALALLTAAADAASNRTEAERAAVRAATDCVAKEVMRLWDLQVAHGRDEYPQPAWGPSASLEQKSILQGMIATVLATPTSDLSRSLRLITGTCQRELTSMVKIFEDIHGEDTGQKF